jgi:hypothetical protein
MPATDPVATTDDGSKHTAAYAADINSLKTLEMSLERDESNWFANIKTLDTGTDDGANVTVATYEDVDNFKMGHLTLVLYSANEDRDKLKDLHKKAGEVFIYDGSCFVNSNRFKVLVFREKPA